LLFGLIAVEVWVNGCFDRYSTRVFNKRKGNVLTVFYQQPHMQQLMPITGAEPFVALTVITCGRVFVKFSMLLIYISRDIYRARNWHLL